MAENKTIKGSIQSLNTYHTDAYMIAVKNGFEGTEREWLDSLRAKNTEEAIAAANRAMEGEKNVKAAEESAKAEIEAATNSAVSHIESMAEEALDIVQVPGNSETAVMSQKATTDLAKMITTYSDEIYSSNSCQFNNVFINRDGIASNKASYSATDYIVVNENSRIKSITQLFSESTISNVAFYDKNKNHISSIGADEHDYNFVIDATPPEGARYARLCFWKSANYVSQIQITSWFRGISENALTQETGDSEDKVMSQKTVTNLVNGLESDINDLADNLENETTKVVENTYTCESCSEKGTINIDGTISKVHNTYSVSDYIYVNENTTIKSSIAFLVYNQSLAVAFYDEDKNFISGITDFTDAAQYGNGINIDTTPPENARFVRLGFTTTATKHSITVTTEWKAVTEDELAEAIADLHEGITHNASNIEALESNIEALESKTTKLIDETYTCESSLIKGKINLDGSIGNHATHGVTDFIRVNENTIINSSTNFLSPANCLIVAFYDANKNLISGLADASGYITIKDATPPENARYIRLYIATTNPINWIRVTTTYEVVTEDAMEDAMEAVMDEIGQGASKVRTINPTAYGLPLLELFGDTATITKDNAVTLSYKYGEREGTCTLKWQGSSSMVYPKKNYTIKFDNEFEAQTGWGEQKKYCLKANYVDYTHARNICSAKIWGNIVKRRTPANEILNALPNGGAVDGFPICLLINGEYQGLYTFNIPKDGWMFGMGDGTTEAFVCADNSSALACQFRGLATLETLSNGSADFEVEYAPDEDDTEWIKTSLNRLLQACVDCNSAEDFDNNVAQYLDVESAIDYLLFSLVTCNHDGVKKNYILATYDGIKWFFSAYDMDSTFGSAWDGKSFYDYKYCDLNTRLATENRLFELLKTYKAKKLKERYQYLVTARALSDYAVVDTFTSFIGSIPKALYDEEVKMWTGIPSTSISNISQILDFYDRRRKYIDAQIEAL